MIESLVFPRECQSMRNFIRGNSLTREFPFRLFDICSSSKQNHNKIGTLIIGDLIGMLRPSLLNRITVWGFAHEIAIQNNKHSKQNNPKVSPCHQFRCHILNWNGASIQSGLNYSSIIRMRPWYFLMKFGRGDSQWSSLDCNQWRNQRDIGNAISLEWEADLTISAIVECGSTTWRNWNLACHFLYHLNAGN